MPMAPKTPKTEQYEIKCPLFSRFSPKRADPDAGKNRSRADCGGKMHYFPTMMSITSLMSAKLISLSALTSA